MMLKDLKLAQAAAARAGATTPLGAQAEALFALFDRLGFGGKDFSAVIELFRGRLDALEDPADGVRDPARGDGGRRLPGPPQPA
jgi:hypothetical protein